MNPLTLLGGAAVKKIFELFVTKKRVIGWLSAVGLAVGAGMAGMQTREFKDAVCGAQVIEQVKSEK